MYENRAAERTPVMHLSLPPSGEYASHDVNVTLWYCYYATPLLAAILKQQGRSLSGAKMKVECFVLCN